MIDPEILAVHRQELRRGSVVVASLVALRTPGYGYGLLETLERSGVPVDANTLYPLLRRLEKQGLLTSEWNHDTPRPRKFYRTSEQGDALATALLRDWADLDRALRDLTPGGTP
ncbi:MAG: PadR family transcriptional regulator [Candidatus Nanopelagicales bacterium]|jgi:DNA-binding PadR family transcriptional regulator